MKNNLNLLVLFGILFAGFGLCCLSIFTQELLDSGRYNEAFQWKTPHYFFLSSGMISVLTGLGLMLRKNWARLPATLLLIFAAAAWTLFAISEIKNVERDGIITIGFTIFLYSASLFGVLFLNNQYVLRSFDHQDPPEEEEDILDWE